MDLLARVESRVVDIVRPGDSAPPWRLLARICAGGQRIRPWLVLGLADVPSDEAAAAELARDAAGIELVHLSTLIHDDVIDHASTRRGVPTLNASFGPEVALLIGNLVKDRALAMVSAPARDVLNAASADVNGGQLLETLARGRLLDLAELFTIQLHKTARAFRHCARLAERHRSRPLAADAALGLELSALSFQAVDDWLDLAAKAGETGKTASRDADNGVPSFVRCRELGTGSDATEPAVRVALDTLRTLDPRLPLIDRPPAEAQGVILAFVDAVRSRIDALDAGPETRLAVTQLHQRLRHRAQAVSVEPNAGTA